MIFLIWEYNLKSQFAASTVPAYAVTNVLTSGYMRTATVDPNTNRVYIAGYNAFTVKVMSSSNSISVFAGNTASSGFVNGLGTYAKFSSNIYHLYYCNYNSVGVIYIADYSNNLIRMMTTSGVVTTVAGGRLGTTAGSSNGVGTYSLFNLPTGVACDSFNGDVWVADSTNAVIRKIAYGTRLVTTVAGRLSSAGGVVDGLGTYARFSAGMRQIAQNPNNRCFYVVDYSNHVIRQITTSGEVSTIAGTAGSSTPFFEGIGTFASFNFPVGLAFDSFNGNIVVGDQNNYRVRVIESATANVVSIGGNGVGTPYSNGMGTFAKVNKSISKQK